MNKITAYQIGDRYFIPVGIGNVEIPFSKLVEMREQGTEIEIRTEEYYV
ncbi:hypothetical protein [Cytobacillus sp. FSL R5-0596]